jgi:hypothetical protein
MKPIQSLTTLLVIILLALQAAPTNAANSDEIDEEHKKALQQQLNEARQEMQEAASRMAQLTRELYGTEAGQPGRYFFGAQRPRLGLTLGVPEENEAGGLKVRRVLPGLPADLAGIRDGDVLTKVDGITLESDRPEALTEYLAEREAGDTVELEVWRDGETLVVHPELQGAGDGAFAYVFRNLARDLPDMQVLKDEIRSAVDPEAIRREIREHIDPETIRREIRLSIDPEAIRREIQEGLDPAALRERIGMAMGSPWRGIRTTRINPELGQYFGAQQGLLILETRGDADLDLRPGDVILKVGEARPETPQDLIRALHGQADAPHELEILRHGEVMTVTIQPREPLASLFRPGSDS